MTPPDKQDRRYFDEHKIPNDVWSVLRASALLSVGEFRVFEIAYEDWYGEAGEEKMIENHFTGYMFNDIVPPWVRHFCKKVLKRDSEGTLDPAEFGIVHKAASRKQINKGLEAIMYIVGALIILFLLGESAAQVLKLQCMFPPCY
ncbi:MAG: hypothetical protein ACE5FM_03460 [Methyloligellaceae bacterium]